MSEVLKRLLGLAADPDTSGTLQPSWPAVRKSIRDAALVGLACAGLALLKSAEAVDWSATEWAWVWQAAVTTGGVAFVRRWLVDYSGGAK